MQGRTLLIHRHGCPGRRRACRDDDAGAALFGRRCCCCPYRSAALLAAAMLAAAFSRVLACVWDGGDPYRDCSCRYVERYDEPTEEASERFEVPPVFDECAHPYAAPWVWGAPSSPEPSPAPASSCCCCGDPAVAGDCARRC